MFPEGVFEGSSRILVRRKSPLFMVFVYKGHTKKNRRHHSSLFLHRHIVGDFERMTLLHEPTHVVDVFLRVCHRMFFQHFFLCLRELHFVFVLQGRTFFYAEV